MSLARIISENQQYANDLAGDLKAWGFEVRTSAPGEPTRGPVDLELTVKECTQADRATPPPLPGDDSVQIFLTPRALSSQVRSVQLFVVKPQESTEVASAGASALTQATSLEMVDDISPDIDFAPVAKLGPQLVHARPQNENVAIPASPDLQAGPSLVPHGLVSQAFLTDDELDDAQQPSWSAHAVRLFSVIRQRMEKAEGWWASRQNWWITRKLSSAKAVSSEQLSAPKSVDRRFWKISALAGAAAVAVLVLVSAFHRVSPLPAGARDPQAAQEPLPFKRTGATPRSAQTGSVAGKRSAQSGQTARNPKPSAGTRKVPTASETRRTPKDRFRDVDIVAEDTVQTGPAVQAAGRTRQDVDKAK